MEEINKETITTTTESVSPKEKAVQTNVSTTIRKDSTSFLLRKFADIVWFIVGLIILLLIVRIIFLLLSANNVGIVSNIYQISNVFIAPFVGIFESPSYGSSFFDAAAMVGVVFYALVGSLITWILSLISSKSNNL